MTAAKAKKAYSSALPASVEEYLHTPDWCKSPAWRWDLITSFVADPYKELKSVKDDKVLVEGAMYYRDKFLHSDRPLDIRTKYPEYALAMDLYTNAHCEGMRWVIEALLMTEMNDDEIVDALKVDISPKAVNIFRKLFFDVDSYRNSDIAMLTNILSVSKLRTGDTSFCDYSWKWFAYVWGSKIFLDQIPGKKSTMDQKYVRWYKGLLKDNLFIQAADLSKNTRNLFNHQALEVLRVAKDYLTVNDDDISTAQSGGIDGFLSDLHKNVDMVLMSSNVKLGAIEERKGFDYRKLRALEKIDGQE
jgi:hypothetical protein